LIVIRIIEKLVHQYDIHLMSLEVKS